MHLIVQDLASAVVRGSSVSGPFFCGSTPRWRRGAGHVGTFTDVLFLHRAISVPFFGSSGLGNWILSGAGAHPDPSSTPEAVDATPLDLHMVLGVLLKPQPDHS